jgi:ferritin-like metal-binding protein YciE
LQKLQGDEMKKEAKFEDLFQRGIESLYDAEKQIVEALPKMAAASFSEELAGAFEAHLQETRQHVVRLETIFEQMSEQPKDRTSQAMRALLTEGEDLIAEIEKSPALDVALAGAARKVEHWEIAAYESLGTLAEVLGLQQIVELLQESLEEEGQADDALADTADAILAGDAGVIVAEEDAEEEPEEV